MAEDSSATTRDTPPCRFHPSGSKLGHPWIPVHFASGWAARFGVAREFYGLTVRVKLVEAVMAVFTESVALSVTV